MYYVVPETPMMSSVIADCPDLVLPPIFWTSLRPWLASRGVTGQDGIGQTFMDKMVAIFIDVNTIELNLYLVTTTDWSKTLKLRYFRGMLFFLNILLKKPTV